VIGPISIISSAQLPRPSGVISETKVDCPALPYVHPDLVFQPEACVHVFDIDQYTHKVNIYRGPIPWSDSPAEIEHLRALTQTATLAMKNAEIFSPPLVVNVIMVGVIEEGRKVGLAANKEAEPLPCSVVITFNVVRSLDETGRRIAHELYHCVQFRNRPELVNFKGSFEWWRESTASYFSDYISPTAHPFALDYEPYEPVYDQKYESSLFFHSLSNQGWSLVKITDYVNGRNFEYAAADERRQLASNTEIIEGFINFAKDFHDKNIVLESVEPPMIVRAVTQHAVPVANEEIIDLPKVGQKSAISVDVRSWTFMKYSVWLQPKQRISISTIWKGESFPQVHLWYRKIQTGKATTEWARGENMPAELTSGCDSSQVIYEFLVVPTDKVDSVKGEFSFTRLENKKCKCEVPRESGGLSRRDDTAADDGDVQCEELTSCLVGTWSADKASYVDAANSDAAARYPGTLFTMQTIAVTGEFTMNISELSLSNDSTVRPLLVWTKQDQWKTVIRFTPTTGPNSEPFDTSSIMDTYGNTTYLRTSDPESTLDLESGSLLSSSSFSKGSIKTSTPYSDEITPIDTHTTSRISGGTYNCTAAKLWLGGDAAGRYTGFYFVRESSAL
jgi:hypothetical protein